MNVNNESNVKGKGVVNAEAMKDVENTSGKTTGRNFYAVKVDRKGNEVPYVFEKLAERNGWIERHVARNARPTSATSVYKMLKRRSKDIIVANRNHRLVVVDSIEAINPDKGQRIVFGH